MTTEGSGKFADIQSLRQHVIRQCDVPGCTQINPSDQGKIDKFKITRNDETISRTDQESQRQNKHRRILQVH